jgi:hypothetical protein
MIMDTERLIETLAADGEFQPMPVSRVLGTAVAIALGVALMMLVLTIGLRPDIMRAMRTPLFDLKFVVTLALAVPAFALCLRAARPAAPLRGRAWLLLAPLPILAMGIGGEMMMPQRPPMLARWIGTNAMLCVAAIPLLSLPLLAAALIGLRQGAPARPALAGALAGLLASGLAATLYAAHCVDDSPLFVATWYTLAVAVVAALGALIGPRVLRY